MSDQTGTLFVVATPIGNLADVSPRAAQILASVGRIACEDTRHTAKLLHHLGVQTPTVSYHEHNERERAGELVAALQAGEDLALVTDAGTPLVSDPGYRLVERASAAGVRVVPVPGASAVMAALMASGLATDEFRFCGFLPPKSGARRSKLASLKNETCTLVFFEAPHRVAETLADIQAELGDRPCVAAREITKLHEEFLRGPISAIVAGFANREPKGEFTLVVGKAAAVNEAPPDASALRQRVADLEREGMSRMDAIKETARRAGLGKREVYQAVETDR
jgi:16S rRNA (cytidine1402-2'-O)-methyltransferase